MEVIGVDLPLTPNPNEKEEKEMYLGRNSNFKVMKPDQMMDVGKSNSYIYISDNSEHWHEYMEDIHLPFKKADKVIQVAMNQIDLSKTQSNLINMTIILPTLYGPWQPENTFLYKCLSSRNQFPFDQYELENKSDAIYSSDAAAAILEIAKLEPGIYQIQTDIKNHWSLLLKELGYEIIFEAGEMDYSCFPRNDVKKYQIKTKISPEVGIERVKRHIRNREIMGY